MITLFVVLKDGSRKRIDALTFTCIDSTLQYIDVNTKKSLMITDIINIFVW